MKHHETDQVEERETIHGPLDMGPARLHRASLLWIVNADKTRNWHRVSVRTPKYKHTLLQFIRTKKERSPEVGSVKNQAPQNKCQMTEYIDIALSDLDLFSAGKRLAG